MIQLTVIVALGLTFALLIGLEVRQTGQLVTPWSLLLVLSLVDIIGGALIVIIYGAPDLPYWFRPPPDDQSVFFAVIIYTMSVAFFGAGYFVARSFRNNTPKGTVTMGEGRLRAGMAHALFALSAICHIGYLSIQVRRAGSLSEYVSLKFKVRWTPEVVELKTFTELVVERLGSAMLAVLILVTATLFYFRHVHNKPVLWGLVLPAMGWLACATTFFRGTQLLLFLALLMAENERLRNAGSASSTRVRKARVAVLAAVAIAGFASYGTIRNYYSSQEWGERANASDAVEAELRRASSGAGLLGLSAILQHYPERTDYFYGRTFLDMLLLPVPRLIYTSKPTWYGIDDITRAMGWPISTQSAVTVPGELWANFGIFGLPLSALGGAALGLAYRLRHGRYFFAYSVIMLQVLLVGFWMSFTGVVNTFAGSFLVIPAGWLLLRSPAHQLQSRISHGQPSISPALNDGV